MIPVYNAEAYLAECLDSLLAGHPAGLEIVAIDDGSSDASAAILQAFSARHPCIRTHRRANGGPAAARNFGLAQATGEYVWFVDADDVIMPSAWETVSTLLAGSPDIAVHNGERFGGGEPARRFFMQSKPGGAVSGQQWVELLCEQREFHHLVYLHLYRRAFLNEHGLRFLEGVLHEDIGWVTETYLCARRVVYTDEVLYGYRRNAASLTGSREDAKLLRRIDSYFAVVPQLRTINARYAMDESLLLRLRAEVVGQGLQVDRLATRLQAPASRREVRARCKRERFWASLWPDATTFKAKRQLAKVMLRDFFR